MTKHADSDTIVLPNEGNIRLDVVLAVTGYKKDKWYRGIKAGKFPKPFKDGRDSFWDVQDIRRVIEDVRNGKYATEK